MTQITETYGTDLYAIDEAKPFVGNDRLLIGIILGVLTYWLFAQSLFNVAPDIVQSIGIPLDTLTMAISLTALFSGCFIVVAGGLADKFGRVRLTYVGFILSIIGCLCLIFAQGTWLFTTGRVIQGLSAACIMPATLALVKAYYHDAARQRALSFWSIGSWGGSSICSLAGGGIATYFGWRWIFIFSIIFALVGMLLMKGTPESKMEQNDKASRFDYTGLLFFVVSLVSLNLIITKGAYFGWASAATLGLSAICIVTLITFFAIERAKAHKAFIDFSLFKNMAYSGASFSNFLLNSAVGTLLIVNIYIQTGRGFTAFQTGLLSIGYLVAVLSMIRVGEKVLQKIGAKKPMLLGTLVTAFGIIMTSLTFLPQIPYLIMVSVGFLTFGIGLGFYATPSIDTAITNVPEEKVGVASGIYKMGSSLGGAFGIAISTAIYIALMKMTPSIHFAAGIALLVNAGFCVLSAFAVLFLIPRKAGVPD